MHRPCSTPCRPRSRATDRPSDAPRRPSQSPPRSAGRGGRCVSAVPPNRVPPRPSLSQRAERMTRSKRIYVLDTNVLMHDPTALFKFEEHDVFLPMQVIEELDNAKKGTSEASRNARHVSRFLNELIEAHGTGKIATGIPLTRPDGLQLRGAQSAGC